MKRILALVLAAMMLLSMAACAASTPAAAEAAADTNTEAVTGVEDGVLTVGMECAYAPYNWTQMDDSNGAVPISNVPGAYANGYDVMIAQKICEANGWQLEIVSSAWDSLCPAVQSGTMDANIAGQSMTADRMQEVDMAGPYYSPPSSASPRRTAPMPVRPPLPTSRAASAPRSPARSGTIPACRRSKTQSFWLPLRRLRP